jgi:hypothetical protein
MSRKKWVALIQCAPLFHTRTFKRVQLLKKQISEDRNSTVQLSRWNSGTQGYRRIYFPDHGTRFAEECIRDIRAVLGPHTTRPHSVFSTADKILNEGRNGVFTFPVLLESNYVSSDTS